MSRFIRLYLILYSKRPPQSYGFNAKNSLKSDPPSPRYYFIGLQFYLADNNGMCELCDLELEDLHHFLLPKCPALLSRANILLAYMQEVLKQSEACLIIFGDILQQSRKDCRLWVQFVLDCSVIPQVVQVSQTDKAVLQLLFKVTRTWCYSLHRTRLKLLGRWCT